MKKNNIWLITIGEPIFHPKNKLRKHRTGLLADYISRNSKDNVVWFTSTFNHFTKKHEYNKDVCIHLRKNFKMIALYGFGYKKNVSFQRILDHYIIEKKIKNFFY